MRRSSALLAGLGLLALASAPRPCAAAWPHDASNGNLPVSAGVGDQLSPATIPDGAGGAFLVWTDTRGGGSYDIYAQRINASGVAIWTADGVPVCTASGYQYSPMIATDGAGGAIITWYDYRAANADVYVQRLNSAGVAQWVANGVALCTATGDQTSPTITSDGASGAIVTWADSRGASTDIYAQRVSAAGTPQWTANGVPLCTATSIQQSPVIAPDGAAGAFVAWIDYRTGGADIYLQHVFAAGGIQFATDGVAFCSAASAQEYPVITADGSGGAIVVWRDFRNGTNYDIYAGRISGAGASLWTGNGVALCTATGSQVSPVITTDGAGGAIVAWQDARTGVVPQVYAQRVSAGARPSGPRMALRCVRRLGPTSVPSSPRTAPAARSSRGRTGAMASTTTCTRSASALPGPRSGRGMAWHCALRRSTRRCPPSPPTERAAQSSRGRTTATAATTSTRSASSASASSAAPSPRLST